MTSNQSSPLVLIAFNRPDLLQAQLEVVRKYFRGTIFAIIDGPRLNRPEEVDRVNEVAELFASLATEFQVSINRSTENLGCYQRIKSGLDWVFEQTDRAIILEDDCLPSPQFFEFASEMLERFAHDNRIYSISGTNLFPQHSLSDQSYWFSRYHNCWGWATWGRAWKGFIDEKEEWDRIRGSKLFRDVFRNLRSYLYWRWILDRTYGGHINSWAYRWTLSCWMQSGLSIHAAVNLISNVGDGDQATNTSGSKETHRPLGSLKGPLSQPKYVVQNFRYDEAFENIVFSKSLPQRLLWCIKKIRRK